MVKYSFENNLITPLGRIVIGGAVGLALVATGWWLAAVAIGSPRKVFAPPVSSFFTRIFLPRIPFTG